MIAFVRGDLEKRTSSLWVVRPDGSHLRRLPWSRPRGKLAYGSPQWSPDGRALAVTAGRRNDFFSPSRIMIARPWDSKPRFFAYGSSPAWSPDGRRIAFTTVRENDPYEPYETTYLWTKPVNGGKKRLLTKWPEVSLSGLAWSPDGSRIAFDEDSSAFGYDRDIYTVTAEGGVNEPLVERGDRDAGVDWHPDGFPVVFDCEWNTYWTELCLFDPATPGDDGTGVHYLMHENGEGQEDGWDFSPAWSPSGRRIVWSRAALNTRSYDLFTMRPDGSGWKRITRTATSDVQPAWRPRP